MKIAIFTDVFIPDINGVSNSTNRFSRLLAAEGHQIIIFCPKSAGYKDPVIPNITVKRFNSVSFLTYKEIKIALPFIYTIINQLKRFQPDVVHIQTPMPIGWTGLLATKILGLKNIQTYHTYIPDDMVYLNPKSIPIVKKLMIRVEDLKILKILLDADVFEEMSFKKLKEKLQSKTENIYKKVPKSKTNKISARFAWEFTRAVYNRADLVLTPSQTLKKELKANGIKPRIEVLSNGINLEMFERKTDYRIRNKILYIGRLGFEKNVEVIIHAVAILAKENKDIILDIVGDGPARLPLEKLTKNLGLKKNIRFLGFISDEEMKKMHQHYDLFVTASTMETQGLVILEAMTAGLPVLGVNKLAVPELIKNNVNGYVSVPHHATDLAKNIKKLLTDSEKLKKFGRNSVRLASEHEITKCKDRLLKFYIEVADHKKSKNPARLQRKRS